MRHLNWFNKDAPDDSMYVCGVPITPEAWIGGVCEYGESATARTGPWHIARRGGGAIGLISDADVIVMRPFPVYPPVGFGGLEEFDISEAMRIAFGNPHTLYDDGGLGVLTVNPFGEIELGHGHVEEQEEYSAEIEPSEIEDINAFTLALQNASVLSTRLKEGRRE